MKKKWTNKRGQGVVEFAFVSFIFLNLFFLTLNGILAFSVHQYISYATFMAARTYQASDVTAERQSRKARAVLDEYFKIPGIKKELARIRDIQVPSSTNPPPYGYGPPSPGQQIKVVFEVPLFQFPLGAASKSFGWIELESISYLGREPSIQECNTFFRTFWGFYGGGGSKWKGMDDNNC